MPAPRLSVILITKNEAHNIRACLESVKFADEWVVVDSGSGDATVEIARDMGAKVVVLADWPGFGAQKNRALALATAPWVLSIDADERVSPDLAARIQAVVAPDSASAGGRGSAPRASPQPVAYELSRISSFCGQWMRHGDWYPDRVLRLFRREGARFSDDLVHERLMIDGPTARLEGNLMHNTMPNLDDALDKLNRYTSGRALDLLRRGKRGGLASALGHGLWAFVRSYALKRGFLDGRLGLVLAIYIAHSTYYRYLKMGLAASGTAK